MRAPSAVMLSGAQPASSSPSATAAASRAARPRRALERTRFTTGFTVCTALVVDSSIGRRPCWFRAVGLWRTLAYPRWSALAAHRWDETAAVDGDVDGDGSEASQAVTASATSAATSAG